MVGSVNRSAIHACLEFYLLGSSWTFFMREILNNGHKKYKTNVNAPFLPHQGWDLEDARATLHNN